MTKRADFQAAMMKKLEEQSANADPQRPVRARAPETPVALHARELRQGLEDQLEELRERLKQGAVQKLDPTRVRRSRWCNRHPAAFEDAVFRQLKESITRTGGNEQPILVRPLEGLEGEYELVYGHRRHEACRQLGVPVRALVSEVSDEELPRLMEWENADRSDLSAYEQGMQYARMLREGLYPDARSLAQAFNRSDALISRLLSYAELPADVIGLFPDPRKLSAKSAEALRAALKKDRARVLEVAAEIKSSGEPANTQGRVDRLLNAKPPARVVQHKGKDGLVVRITRAHGRVQLEIHRDLSAQQLKELLQQIERLAPATSG